MKIDIEAGELSKADVEWVSLVKKPANKIPFKVIKTEKGMGLDISLKSLISKHQAKMETDVQAIVTTKSDNIELKQELIKAAGYSVDGAYEENGAMIYPQGEFSDEKEHIAVKMGDFTVMVPKQKGMSYWYESDSFNEVYAVDNVYNGLYDAGSVLSKTVGFALENADSPEAAQKKIKSILKQHSDFITGLLDQVPMNAFKLEKEVPVLEQVDSEKADEEEVVDTEETEGNTSDEPAADTEASEKSEESAGEDTSKADDKAEKIVDVQEETEKSGSNLAASLESLHELVAGFGLKLTDLATKVDKQTMAVDTKLAAVENKVKSFADSVDLDNHDGNTEEDLVSKTEDHSGLSFGFDTGLGSGIPGSN